MKILIACEFSGTVRDAFLAKGHDAISADLLPTESDGPHYQGNVLDILYEPYDLLIAHPPCQYLTNSGVRWMYKGGKKANGTDEERWAHMYAAQAFFEALNEAHHIRRRCIENPVPHGHAGLPAFTQSIQPWQFGHGETKATCLWLKGLPKLTPTNIVEGREQRIHLLPSLF